MFFSKQGSDKESGVDSRQTESVSDYVQRKFKKEEVKVKTMEEKEVDEEMVALDKEVEYMIERKLKEFSFETKEDLVHYPEEQDLEKAILKLVEDYKVCRKMGMGEEAMSLRHSLKELKFAKQHLV